MHICAMSFSAQPTKETARALFSELMRRHPCVLAHGCAAIPFIFDYPRALLIALIDMESEPDMAAAESEAARDVEGCAKSCGAGELLPLNRATRPLDGQAIERAWTQIDTHRVDGMFNAHFFECIAGLNYERIPLERVLPETVRRKADYLGAPAELKPAAYSAEDDSAPDNGKPEGALKATPGEISPIPKLAPSNAAKPGADKSDAADDLTSAAQPGAQPASPDAPVANRAPEMPGREKFAERPATDYASDVDQQAEMARRISLIISSELNKSPALMSEISAVRRMAEESRRQGWRLSAFSFRVDTGRGEYAKAISDCLMGAVDAAKGVARAPIEWFSVSDFKSRSERFTESQPIDYDALKKRLYGKHFCLTDTDMLSGLSARDFSAFIGFLTPYADTHMVFCGDLTPESPHMRARWDEIEALINVRRVNGREIAIDECGAIESALHLERLTPPEAELRRAFATYRRSRGGADIGESMTRFACRTLFAHYENLAAGADASYGQMRAEDFEWTHLLGDADSENKPAAFDELNALIGLDKVKRAINGVIAHALISQRKERAGLAAVKPTYTFLMLGAPGTGKTTVAMLLGRIFRELGLLRSGRVVTAGRADLVGAYVGHSALKTNELFMSALGGVLFVDEAYSLAAGDRADSFGGEVLSTLAQLMTEHAGEICVIFAGYDKPMQNMLDQNPGLRHRFAYTLRFEDYSCAEMRQIFDLKARARQFKPDPDCLDATYALIDRVTRARTENFANGRVIDNILQYLVAAQESRLAVKARVGQDISPEELTRLTGQDAADAFSNDAVRALTKDARRRVGF